VEHREHQSALLVGQRASWPRPRLRRGLGLLRAVVARAAHAERNARSDDADERDEEREALHHDLRPGLMSRRPGRNRPCACAKSSSVGSGSVSPNRAATFRWTSMTVLALSSSCFTRSSSRWSLATSSVTGFLVARLQRELDRVKQELDKAN